MDSGYSVDRSDPSALDPPNHDLVHRLPCPLHSKSTCGITAVNAQFPRGKHVMFWNHR